MIILSRSGTQRREIDLSVHNTAAYIGAPGSFTYEAARRICSDAILTGFESVDDVFDAVLKGKVTRGIVPFENTLAGGIEEVKKRIQDGDIEIFGRLKLKIFQRLMAPKGTKLSNIRKIYSHYKALEQCKGFLATMENCQTIPYTTTSAAAAAVAALNDKRSAAIASGAAARLNRLVIIKKEIQDSPENYTEFIAFKKK